MFTKNLDFAPYVVNKVMKIGILDFELGAFSETSEHMMSGTRRLFGFSLQKKTGFFYFCMLVLRTAKK